MRRVCNQVLFLVVSSILSVSAFAEPQLTGQSWIDMNNKDRLVFVTSTMELFQANGATLTKSPFDYMVLLDKYLEAHPDLAGEELGNLFINMLWESEPEARGSLEPLVKEIKTLN